MKFKRGLKLHQQLKLKLAAMGHHRMLDSYWKKLFCQFCVTVRRFDARVQSSIYATYKKCSNSRADSEIGHATACLYIFWDRQKAEFCML